MARHFARTLQAHRLALHWLWIVVLGGSCLLAIGWAWWAFTDHGDEVLGKQPDGRSRAAR